MSTPVILMRTPAETALIERFADEKATLPGAAAAREEAFARFAAKGLPTKRVESYHYSDLRAAMRSLAPRPSLTKAEAGRAFSGFTRLSFVNGVFQGEAAPSGITLEPLAEALEAGCITPNAVMGAASDVVVDLNTAFAREGLVLHVAKGVTTPLHLAFIAAGPGAGFSRMIVDVAPGACLTLLETHEGGAEAYQVNAMVEFRLGAGAKVEHLHLNEAGQAAMMLTTLATTLAEEAEFSSLNVALGGAFTRHQVFVTFAGENAKSTIKGASLLSGTQHHDTTLVVDHALALGISRELFKTVVDDAAQGVFQGKIIVRQYAQKTDGQMASNALLLSDEAGMSNKPELEIFADDVVCAHGATCGALDESQLFYLMARGIPKKEAEAMLIEAFLAEALDEVTHEETREVLSGLLSAALRRRVS